MKKNEKIMIGILIVIIILIIGGLLFPKTKAKQKVGNITTDIENTNNVEEVEQKEIGRIIKVKGTLYYDTGRISENIPRCGTMDGNITSILSKEEIPTEDGQANFEGARGYQYTSKNTIEIPFENEGWVIFESKEFIIKVYDKSPEEFNKVHTILDKNETDKYDYNIYANKVNVNIVIDGIEMPLRNALLENKITMEAIIEKANRDLPEAEVYKDGGSKVYDYKLYTIIKLNKIMNNTEVNKDVYIGMPGSNINDLVIE